MALSLCRLDDFIPNVNWNSNEELFQSDSILACIEAVIPPLHIIWMKIGALQFLSVLISIFYRGQMPLSIDCYWHFKRAISDFLVFSTTIHIIANSPLLTQFLGAKKCNNPLEH